jgi:hypothetical protein
MPAEVVNMSDVNNILIPGTKIKLPNLGNIECTVKQWTRDNSRHKAINGYLVDAGDGRTMSIKLDEKFEVVR